MTGTRSVVRERPFLWFWGADAFSQFGAQFTSLAIPVLAVTLLGATEWQMGLLNAAGTAAFLVVGLPAGAWVDRWMKRRTMILADLVRAAALAVLPVLWFADSLEMWHLYLVGAVVGVATVFFDVSYQSYIPVLVTRRQIGDANAKLEATHQIAEIGGPGAAGALLAVLTAPALLLVNVAGYLASALLLTRVRDTEVPLERAARRGLATEIAEGVRFVATQPIIRRIVGTTAAFNLFQTLTFTLLPIFALRTLQLEPVAFGLVFSFGAAGGLLGALATSWLIRRLGEGPTITWSAIVGALVTVLFPLAAAAPQAAVPLLLAAQFATMFTVLTYNIAQVTLRQKLCPPRLLGRMNASIRFVVWGVMPLSSLAAGALGSTAGTTATLWVATVGTMLGSLFVVLSPLWRLREVPDPALADDAAASA